MSNPSNVRVIAYNIFNRIDQLAFRYIQHQTIAQFVARLVRPRIQNLILRDIPEEELKQILQTCFLELKPHFDNMQMGHEIKEARKLNQYQGKRGETFKHIEKNLESYIGVFD